MYRRAESAPTVEGFLSRTLAEVGVSWESNELDLARIPRSGGCIVVANHPFGAVEGVVLGSMLRRIRPDVKILANHLLARLEPLTDILLSVDPFGRTSSTVSNFSALRSAVRFLKNGGMLAMFPAGEVAHFDMMRGRVVDAPWNEALAHLARTSKAQVLPVYFSGQNGPFFQLAGMVHPLLRTALLPHELLNKKGTQIEVRVGTVVPHRKLMSFSNDKDIVAYLRGRTSMLCQRASSLSRGQDAKHAHTGTPHGARWPLRQLNLQPLVAPIDSALMAREVDALPHGQVLVDEADRVVVWARAAQIPATLAEIGRLRELTFREAGEGTGKSTDLDAFDRTYLHLFAFDRRDRGVVGAYRLGPTDELLARGPRGLYTSTLFEMRPELFRRMGPALEMGRSFVCSRYRRSASGLFLLWRGIGQFILEHPHYRVLFGPVSISAAYAQVSRELMVDFIKLGDHMHPFGRYVRARHPFTRRWGASIESGLPVARFLQDIEEVSGLVADIEPDQKGVPVLFKQYLKLGGKMLGFNVDPKFSGVLDGLVLVDLLETNPKTLSRYLGAEQAAAFLAHHRSEIEQAESQVAG
jgi:putative hemolysin